MGNFVELKKTRLGAGAKSQHLAYLGDAEIGDGRQHRRRDHHLQLRRRARSTRPRSARAPSSAATRRWWRRSRSATESYIGAGSVITEPVPARTLALGRGTPGDKAGLGRKTEEIANERELFL